MNSTLTSYLERHEATLASLIEQADIPAARIKEATAYSLFPGGKRLRPLLVYCCGEILQVPLPALDTIAAAIELTHCYSLVHDDLPAMDNDDFRRGKPSCHRAFDEATAILTGDGLQALAMEVLLTHLPNTLSPQQIIAVCLELAKASGPSGMVSGQSLDLSELIQADLTEHQLVRVHELKTGKLFSTCINMVLASTPSSLEIDGLRKFGEQLGIVFQMQDDYLDCYAPIEHLGKNRSSDIANEKITFARFYNKDTLRNMIHQQFAALDERLSIYPNASSLRSLLIDMLVC